MNSNKGIKMLSKFFFIIIKILEKLHRSNSLPLTLAIVLENIIAKARGKSVRFGVDDSGYLFAKEWGQKVKISNHGRGFWLYRNGIGAREDFIFKSYCLQNIEFRQGDIVFDCGANSGDLFLSFSKLININNYYGFEPNPTDFNVLRFNVHGSKNLFNLALGNVDKNLDFYVATNGGDSSIVEPQKYTEKIIVKCIRLDSFMVEKEIDHIKLLKIEAEGFEPEILEGLGDKIRNCEYIALDGGYERGKDCEQTFTRCTNYLLDNGFELIDIYFPWCRALYKLK